jgi:hypothetical protein
MAKELGASELFTANLTEGPKVPGLTQMAFKVLAKKFEAIPNVVTAAKCPLGTEANCEKTVDNANNEEKNFTHLRRV